MGTAAGSLGPEAYGTQPVVLGLQGSSLRRMPTHCSTSSCRDPLAAHQVAGPVDQQAVRILPAARIAQPGAETTQQEPEGEEMPTLGAGWCGWGSAFGKHRG